MFTATQCIEFAEKAKREAVLKVCLRAYHQLGREASDDLARFMGIELPDWERAIDNWHYEQERILADEAENERFHEFMQEEVAA
jgi:hypothetical protein